MLLLPRIALTGSEIIAHGTTGTHASDLAPMHDDAAAVRLGRHARHCRITKARDVVDDGDTKTHRNLGDGGMTGVNGHDRRGGLREDTADALIAILSVRDGAGIFAKGVFEKHRRPFAMRSRRIIIISAVLGYVVAAVDRKSVV